jgi:hypothetical protein
MPIACTGAIDDQILMGPFHAQDRLCRRRTTNISKTDKQNAFQKGPLGLVIGVIHCVLAIQINHNI